MILDLPEPIHCHVLQEYLTNGAENSVEECYIFAVTALENRTLLFTCHTENGAVFSRLPIWAFRTKDYTDAGEDLDLETLCPWSALGGNASIIKHRYLKDYEVKCKIGDEFVAGRYLFTIDYNEGLYAQDPEQHKTHNVIELDSGFYAALPNNFCLFEDSHFVKSAPKSSHYARNEIYFRSLG